MRYVWNIPKIYLRCTWDLLKICLRFAWNMPNIFSLIYMRYALNKLKICLWYAKDMSMIFMRYAWIMHDICSRYFVLDMHDIFQRYILDWLWVKSQRAKKKPATEWVSESVTARIVSQKLSSKTFLKHKMFFGLASKIDEDPYKQSVTSEPSVPW